MSDARNPKTGRIPSEMFFFLSPSDKGSREIVSDPRICSYTLGPQGASES